MPIFAASVAMTMYSLLLLALVIVTMRYFSLIDHFVDLDISISPSLPEKVNTGWPAIAILAFHYTYYKSKGRWRNIIENYEFLSEKDRDIYAVTTCIMIVLPIIAILLLG